MLTTGWVASPSSVTRVLFALSVVEPERPSAMEALHVLVTSAALITSAMDVFKVLMSVELTTDPAEPIVPWC